MSTFATPRVVHALYDLAVTALPDSLVSIGFKLGDDPSQLVMMIGVDNPTEVSPANGAAGSQIMATLGPNRTRDHTGTITCASAAWNGDRDQAAAMDAAYAQIDTLAEVVRNDPTIGIGPPGFNVVQMTDDTWSTDDFTQGASALVVFTVAFKARI